jgi:hypothetical protein
VDRICARVELVPREEAGKGDAAFFLFLLLSSFPKSPVVVRGVGARKRTRRRRMCRRTAAGGGSRRRGALPTFIVLEGVAE